MSNPTDFIVFGITVLNYNASATVEDGSCQYEYDFSRSVNSFCVDPNALNYDSQWDPNVNPVLQEFYNSGVFNEDSTLCQYPLPVEGYRCLSL